MSTYCCVHEPHKASKSLFGVPNNLEIKILCKEALGVQLKKSHRVCAKHFYDNDIVLGTQIKDLLNIL
ncbi:52 kDa repressor of the inhibitor of the protein kinase-like [Aphis craccivora]|uniref:52 kDa repressor of the inhibitor of the protein kinase-like n=1 Tax=Aphis craccivora TaxID=307492 RepID=A0A6G0Y6H7_APHCR|nr:52 kDa repressor of the inhibitor of the protein kinase-like [Aphis craccivora]